MIHVAIESELLVYCESVVNMNLNCLCCWMMMEGVDGCCWMGIANGELELECMRLQVNCVEKIEMNEYCVYGDWKL